MCRVGCHSLFFGEPYTLISRGPLGLWLPAASAYFEVPGLGSRAFVFRV